MQLVTTARVSTNMKRAAVAVAVAAIAGAIWYLQRPRGTAASAPDPLPAATNRPKPIARVTRLANAEQRKHLAGSIATAQAIRAAAATSSGSDTGGAASRARPAPSLPADVVAANAAKDSSNLDTLKVEIRAAMREVIPILAECYQAEMDNMADEQTRIVAELTLTGDPDVGTLVDAHQIFDDKQKPLATKFDDCLRTTFQLIALPPLAEGDRVEVRYPFLFAKQ
jgi:hypothetical protein